MIRIVLVDDQEMVRTGLRALAERDGDIAVVGEAANGRAGLSRVRELRPHLWVKGGDYAASELPEAGVLAGWGGRALTVPYLAGRSTSALVGAARTEA